MPRPLRIEYAGAWYHVMNRGTNRQLIFKNNKHRKMFLWLLDEISSQFKIEVHAYCLMSNHYHLLVCTPFANLSRAMRHLDGVYTQRYNLSVGRDGSLFRGRYKSILVEDNDYLLQVSKYIHLNPIEANICNKARDFLWSSYRAYLDVKMSVHWLHRSFLLNLIGGKQPEKKYCEFVESDIDEETQDFYSKKSLPAIFGSKQFINDKLLSLDQEYKTNVLTDINHTKQLASIDNISKIVANYYQIGVNSLKEGKQGKRNIPRMMAMILSRHCGHHTHQQISNYFSNVARSSISPLLIRYAALTNKNNKLNHDLNVLKKAIWMQSTNMFDVST